MVVLNKGNIETELEKYVSDIYETKINFDYRDVMEYLYDLKRKPLKSGRYKGVSVFEAGNRIFSDLVTLIGVKQILVNLKIGGTLLPFHEYVAALGVEGGNDIYAEEGPFTLIGEAFNVARSYFPTKKSREINKLLNKTADFKIIIFNSEAVDNPDSYTLDSQTSILFLPVDIWPELRRYRR